MNQQDKTCLENICKAFFILPSDERKYLAGVADGMAAMVARVIDRADVQQAQVSA